MSEPIRQLDLRYSRSLAENMAIDRAARRYRGAPRFDRHYVTGKLRRDPLYRALPLLAPDGFGEVLDIGCGRGQLGILLLEQRRALSVRGLDWNAAHLEYGCQAATNLAFTVEHCDLNQVGSVDLADTVFLIDVLYQLDTEAQLRLLARASHAARSLLIVRTLRNAGGLRRRAVLALEHFTRQIWPNSGAVVNPQPVETLINYVEARGFRSSFAKDTESPFANVTLVFRRESGL